MDDARWREQLSQPTRALRLLRIGTALAFGSFERLRAAATPAPLRISAAGLNHIPSNGGFVIAANHFSGAMSLVCVAAIVQAVSRVRPKAKEHVLLIAGQRLNGDVAAPRSNPARLIANKVLGRWHTHLLRIPWRNPQASPAKLREWRKRCGNAISIVLPEGRNGLRLGDMRRGSGRWLARMPVHTVPCACWHEDGHWCVRFGGAIAWAADDTLHDLQLGLNLARLLPAALRVHWQADLDEWLAS
jgi:hypothetical protein